MQRDARIWPTAVQPGLTRLRRTTSIEWTEARRLCRISTTSQAAQEPARGKQQLSCRKTCCAHASRNPIAER